MLLLLPSLWIGMSSTANIARAYSSVDRSISGPGNGISLSASSISGWNSYAHSPLPYAHQQIEIGHRLRHMNSRRPRRPDAPDRLDPLRYFLGVLVGLLDGGNQRLLHQAGPRVRPVMQVLHFDGGRVGGLQARLVQHAESEHLLGLVGAWDLHEGVDLPHCRDILGNEGLQLSVELHVRWLEPRDVLKQFLHFCRHLEARVVGRVVRARDVLLFVRLVFLVARLRPALDLLDPWVFWRSA